MNVKQKLVTTAALVSLMAAAAPAMADKLDDVISAGELKCGVMLDYPPNGFRDSSNNPTGYDVEYCQDLAKLKGLQVTGAPDWAALEQAGWARLARVRNLEQVRNLFRRPLELWLVLDRALYLGEQGFEVRLGSFCPYPLTPRNLMLLAERG